jgi:GntR family negative regulator for fad regulon and positive regulator of fabA
MKPTQFAEHKLVTAILDGTFPPGQTFPNERSLAQQLGVTRPTLRETLQRLAREGWIRIRHGKPTKVNDYWEKGGLGLLHTISKYGEYLPRGFISHLLEVRAILVPPVAYLAVQRSPQAIKTHLKKAKKIKEAPETYAAYDWNLQLLLAKMSKNPIFPMILNDFSSIYQSLATVYFQYADARQTSKTYYRKLDLAVDVGADAAEKVVREAMVTSVHIWNHIQSKKENPHATLERMGR